MADPLIDLQDISRTYQAGEVQVAALRRVSLRIKAGEFVAIMGASGSGKSTLLNLLGCLDRPSSGSYRLNGVDSAHLPKPELARLRNATIGFVFQSFNLLARTSALDNVAVPLLYARVPYRERRARAEAALAQMGLQDRGASKPNQLSGGEQQRVAIARALINHPRLILADEPTGNLDSQTSRQIMQIFTELWRSGLTLVLVTHETDIADYAARLIVMKDGEINSDLEQSANRPLVAHAPV